MKFLKPIMFVCLFAAMAFTANAQKIGYVNSQAIIAVMPDVKEANSNLETYSAQLTKRAEQMYQTLQTKAVALQQKRDNGEISPKQLEIEMASLQAEEQKLMEFQGKSQTDIQVKQNELLEPILQKVQDAIDVIAKEETFTYIFDSSQGMILYADETADITDKVKARLGI
jgi:outer membrane protein